MSFKKLLIVPVLSWLHQSSKLYRPTQCVLARKRSVLVGGVSICRTHIKFWHMHCIVFREV